MAQATVTYDSVMSELKAREFKPVYYLMGDESYYIDKISDWIADNVLQPEERDFNQTIMFGSDVNASQIVDAAKRFAHMTRNVVLGCLVGNVDFLVRERVHARKEVEHVHDGVVDLHGRHFFGSGGQCRTRLRKSATRPRRPRIPQASPSRPTSERANRIEHQAGRLA